MTNETGIYCYVQNNNILHPAVLIGNELVQSRKDGKRHSHAKVFKTLSKDLTFSITKTEILENKKYKFSLQLKHKGKQGTVNLIIDGKQDFDYFFKKFSEYGQATGLQEMIVSCEKVGEGSFAEVYKVITNFDSVMALKAFQKKTLRIHKNKLAFQNEIDIMRSLNNRHIVSLGGLFETQKNIYLKMEYFSLSLKHYIKKNTSIKTQKRIMKQLLQALVQMKQKKIIHRDLKPQNIMIRGKSESVMECVVIDFGLATPTDVQKYIFSRCGTPGFLAPEIARMSTKKDKITPACDIFSLGCIFYRILTKKYIFSAGNYNQVIEKNKNVQIPWEIFDQFSQNCTFMFDIERDLLTKMLEKQPLKRIQPEQALKHAYFIQQIDDDDEIPAEGCDLTRKMRSITSTLNKSRRQSISSIMSSFYSNSNPELTEEMTVSGIQRQKYRVKDSCLSFEGPQKGSEANSRNQDFREATQMRNSRLNKRASRFSQIREHSLL